MAFRSGLFVVLALLCLTHGQTISPPTDNQAFDASGFIVTLYNLNSAAACGAACAGFQESKSYSWIKDSTSGLYQQCTCTNANSKPIYSSNSMAGVITSSYSRSGLSCGSNLLVGTDYNNGAIGPINTYATAAECCTACENYIGCNYYGYAAWGSCYMRSSNANPSPNQYLTSGSVVGPTPAPLRTGKRGIAWFDSYSCTDLQAMTDVAWIYNWGPQPDGPLLQCIQALGIEYVPMLWGIGSNWPISYLYTGATRLLTYNEPNFSSQSALTPAQAAASWPQIQAFASRYNMKISAPSASTGGDLMDPIVWLDQFFAACVGCKVDFITTHIYTCSSVQPVLSQFAKYNLPVWVTEFSCPGATNPSLVAPFMQQALAYMDSNPMFERYSWFGTRIPVTDTWLGYQTSLFNYNGAGLSTLGQIYNTASTPSPVTSSTSIAASTSSASTLTASVSSATAAVTVSSSSSIGSTKAAAASTTSASSTGAVVTSSTSAASASTTASASASASVSASASASASVSASTSASASVSSTKSAASTSSTATAISASASSSTAASASSTAASAASATAASASSTAASASSTAASASAATTSSASSAASSSTTGSLPTLAAPGVPGTTTRPTTPAVTQPPVTTVSTTTPPVTTQAPVTTVRATTQPATTRAPVTTQSPTTRPTTSTRAPTAVRTTAAPTTTHAPVTTRSPTTQAPATTQAPVTTQIPVTTRPPVTTSSPVTTVSATPTRSATSAPTTAVPNNCGASPACGKQCYDPSMYTCSSGVLCSLGMQSCGSACYSPSQYKCVNGALVQL